MTKNINDTSIDTEEISLKELIQKIGEWWSYLKLQWLKIALVGFIGGCIGFVYAWLLPVTYTAKMTFVVEDGKSSGGGLAGLASLAGQFGVDVGGSSGSGLLSGDNILLYFKSESLAREVLLSLYKDGSKETVADVYAETQKLKEDWKKNEKIGQINFPLRTENTVYTRLQDSLIQVMTAVINKESFNVAKTDKKAGFIEVSATMRNEELAKLYCEQIVKRAVERYVITKTKRQKATVDNLQARVDSIAGLLGRKTASGAALQTSSTTMDINPLYRTGTAVAVETTLRDKTMLATIFVEVTKNLEMAKFTLSQETPVIQVVDNPFFPLKKNKTSRLKTAVGFAIGFGFLFLLGLIGKRVYGKLVAE